MVNVRREARWVGQTRKDCVVLYSRVDVYGVPFSWGVARTVVGESELAKRRVKSVQDVNRTLTAAAVFELRFTKLVATSK